MGRSPPSKVRSKGGTARECVPVSRWVARKLLAEGEFEMAYRPAVIGCALMLLVPFWAVGQPQETTTDASNAFRTPWGDPDLQGIWNNATITPLQRPESLGDQVFLTAEEIAAMEQRAAEGFSQANAAQEVRTEPLPVGGNVGAYNSFWTEEGTAVVQTGRTSLISDPPNGQLPQLTSEAEAHRVQDTALNLSGNLANSSKKTFS